MNRFFENIEKQIEFNRDKNIFLENLELFQLTSEMVNAVLDMNRLPADSKNLLMDYVTDKVIEEFCRVNQYYSFDSKAKNDLKKIYADLIERFQTEPALVETISKSHYENLNKWLKKYNPFAEKIYINADKRINSVACSEYSRDLQIQILKIDINQLMQPVVDLGCGKYGYLVNYLKEQEIEVYGIDRFRFDKSYFITADWLEYDFGINKWGTVISNLGFSNHFNHHNLREDGNYLEYAKTYMNILYSLKAGGCFHYAPDLPFIEKYLDSGRFSVKKLEIKECNFKATIVKRLK